MGTCLGCHKREIVSAPYCDVCRYRDKPIWHYTQYELWASITTQLISEYDPTHEIDSKGLKLEFAHGRSPNEAFNAYLLTKSSCSLSY